MNASEATSPTIRNFGIPIEVVRAIHTVSFSVLAITAVGLLLRRVIGAFERPLPVIGLFAVGAFAALCLLTLRAAELNRDGRLTGIKSTAGLFPWCAILVIAAALLIPGTSVVSALLMLLSPAVIGETLIRGFDRRRSDRRLDRDHQPLRNISTSDQLAIEAPAAEIAEAFQIAAEPHATDIADATQTYVRRETEEAVLVEGSMKTTIIPGQRYFTLHVAFCPPMPSAPRVTVEISEGPDAKVKSVKPLPHGVRFEGRLASESEEGAELSIAFSAVAAKV